MKRNETYDTSTEEDLGGTNTILVLVQVQGIQKHLRGLAAINESLKNDLGTQDLITLTEVGKRKSVGETSTTDSDTFQDTVATELVEDELDDNLARFLFFVGNDTTDKVRICGVELIHERVELFAMSLRNGTESALLDDTDTVLDRVGIFGLTGIVNKQVGEAFLGRAGEESRDVFVERILVLVQPVGGVVFDLASVVVQNKALVETRRLVLGRLALPDSVQLVQESLVGSLGHNTLFIEKRQDTNWLHRLAIHLKLITRHTVVFSMRSIVG